VTSSHKNITKAKHRFPLREIRHLPRFFRRFWPIFAITAITSILAFLNYEPGTILIGWDNLSSELGPSINLRRAFFSVWEEYQSLGLLGGMAHAADLPRVLIIYLFSLVPEIPVPSIRYLFTFVPLVLGPIGTYLFLYYRLFKNKLGSRTSQSASFLGGLFYLLNLATMHTFFTPFESFTYFYGTFPWLLLFITGYLENPTYRNLITIFIVSFISAPSYYIETIFVVLCFSLIPFFFESFFSSKHKITSLVSISKSFISILAPNLFWFLPVVFFVFTNGHAGEQAKINLISSPETYFRNLQFGNLLDISLLKGFFFNFLDLSGAGKFDYMLSVWRSHLAIPFINILGYLSVVLILVGVYYSFTKKFSWTKSLFAALMIGFFFLIGGGFLINPTIPLVGELFRSPFTKFSTPLSFTYACFFAVGTVFLLDLFTFLHSHLTYPLTLFTVSLSLILFMSPAFSGNLIDSNMRLKLPAEYTELFTYLKTQDPATRIANFPQYTFWGWNYYDWGYRGSGFLWYGIKQPILDRAFDVWDRSSEGYYEEISSAIFSGNQIGFERLIDKYAINWILLDKHVISPDGKTDLGNSTLEKFLISSPKFSLDKVFNDQIFLYQTKLATPTQNFLSLSHPITNNSHPITPFSSLPLRPNQDWVEKAGFLSLSHPITNNSHPITLHLPSLTDSEKLIPVKVEYQKLPGYLTIRLTPISPILFLDDRQINLDTQATIVNIPLDRPTDAFILQVDHSFWPIQIPAEIPNVDDFMSLATSYLPTNSHFPVNLYTATATNLIDLKSSFFVADPTQCYIEKPNHKIEKIVTADSISLLGTDVVGCLSAPLPFVPTGSLISLSFIYSSPTLTPANGNISDKDFGSSEIPQPLEPRSEPKPAQIFANSTGKFQQVNLILEALDTKAVQEIVYQDIKVSVHQQLFSSTGQIKDIPGKEIVVDDKTDKLQISLPITDTAFDIRQIPESNGLFPENRNCDQYDQGKTVKLISEAGFLYQSQNAIECDYLNLRHLSHSLNYLLSFNVDFQKGLPLTVCLENQSTYRCDIHERLIKTNVFQSLIQPIANPDEPTGYTLHLFNQSIGNRITTNLLRSITIRPVPLNFLKSISISPPTTNNSEPTTNNQELSSAHPSEFLYTVTIPHPKNENQQPITSLNLHQTKSPYWQAVQVSAKDLKLPAWLLTTKIFFNYFKLTKLTHNDSNFWYNSWLVPTQVTNNSEPTTLTLIYLPQYLEFIGLAIFPLAFLFVIANLVIKLKQSIPKIKKKS